MLHLLVHPEGVLTQSPSNTWDRVLEKIQPKVSKHSFSTWFKPTKYLSEDAAEIRIRVPNPWFAEWLLSHYSNQLDQALRDVGRPGLRVDFLPLQDFSSSKPAPAPSPDRPRRRPAASSNRAPAYQNQNGGNSPARPPAAAAPDLPERSAASANPALNPSRARTEKRTGSAFERTGAPSPAAGLDIPLAPTGTLNPKYTFDTFVVSNCNEFAHAASLRVAERPSRSYNPLYIYGGVGLGKTHLMQAVGNLICSGGRMRMQYTSSEAFMNELINAIRFENTHEFKDRYRNIDVLLIDDIQFLAGKERTQEEFFHTFNALYDAQKQIVITSDVPPRDIPTLEERLRSRFEWGLIADIQPPDLETKIAILRKKAESDGFRVPDDVTVFIASHCGANIRELEGALTKVIAYASLSGRDVSVDIAREQLRDLLPSEAPATTVENIQKVVANYYGLNVKDLKAKNNSPQVALPRQVAMYLCKELTPCSLPEIGRRFGGKHHSTVHHAVSKVRQRRADQMDFNNLVETLLKSMSKLA